MKNCQYFKFFSRLEREKLNCVIKMPFVTSTKPITREYSNHIRIQWIIKYDFNPLGINVNASEAMLAVERMETVQMYAREDVKIRFVEQKSFKME